MMMCEEGKGRTESPDAMRAEEKESEGKGGPMGVRSISSTSQVVCWAAELDGKKK